MFVGSSQTTRPGLSRFCFYENAEEWQGVTGLAFRDGPNRSVQNMKVHPFYLVVGWLALLKVPSPCSNCSFIWTLFCVSATFYLAVKTWGNNRGNEKAFRYRFDEDSEIIVCVASIQVEFLGELLRVNYFNHLCQVHSHQKGRTVCFKKSHLQYKYVLCRQNHNIVWHLFDPGTGPCGPLFWRSREVLWRCWQVGKSRYASQERGNVLRDESDIPAARNSRKNEMAQPEIDEGKTRRHHMAFASAFSRPSTVAPFYFSSRIAGFHVPQVVTHVRRSGRSFWRGWNVLPEGKREAGAGRSIAHELPMRRSQRWAEKEGSSGMWTLGSP